MKIEITDNDKKRLGFILTILFTVANALGISVSYMDGASVEQPFEIAEACITQLEDRYGDLSQDCLNSLKRLQVRISKILSSVEEDTYIDEGLNDGIN